MEWSFWEFTNQNWATDYDGFTDWWSSSNWNGYLIFNIYSQMQKYLMSSTIMELQIEAKSPSLLWFSISISNSNPKYRNNVLVLAHPWQQKIVRLLLFFSLQMQIETETFVQIFAYEIGCHVHCTRYSEQWAESTLYNCIHFKWKWECKLQTFKFNVNLWCNHSKSGAVQYFH